MTAGTWTTEVHAKARLLHDQIAALSVKAAEAQDDGALAEMLCRPYYTLLDRLFSEELPWAQAMDSSDLVVRLRGPAADDPAPRIKMIADTFDVIRQQVQRIARAIAGAVDPSARFPSELDLGLTGFARGSVVLGLKVRAGNGTSDLLGEHDALFQATREAVHRLGEVARYVDDEGLAPEFSARVEDPGVRDAVLGAASKLAPSGLKGIDVVELTAPDDAAHSAAMTATTRRTLRQALARPVQKHGFGEFVGVVRELDLDLMRFELRRLQAVESLRCAYLDIPEDRARGLLNATVRVSGPVEHDARGRPRLLQVERWEILQTAPQQHTLQLPAAEDE